MQKLTLQTVEEILKGKISKNPNRFNCANGIVFSVNKMTDDIHSYFSERGIEINELVSGIYYTETVMSVAEFEQLDHVMNAKHIA